MGAPRVLIVGLSTRAFALSARRAGYECVSVDAFGDLDQRARVETVGLQRDRGRPYSAAAAVAVGRSFATEAAAYVGNLENHPSAVRRLALGRRLLGNTPATLSRARDFRELATVVERAGSLVPLTLPSTTRGVPPGRSWLRKPLRGGGGSGVALLAPGASVREDELIQERIEGVLASMAFASDGRRAVILGLSYGLAGDPAFGTQGYRYCGSIYPFLADEGLRARLDAIAQVATRAFGLVGVNGLDFLVRGGQLFVLELNPRYCASMELLERSGGPYVFGVHAAACGGSLPSPSGVVPPQVWGKAVLWARAPVVAPDTRSWLARPELADIPFPGERIRPGYPICTLFASGADRADCYLNLVNAAKSLEQELGSSAGGAGP